MAGGDSFIYVRGGAQLGGVSNQTFVDANSSSSGDMTTAVTIYDDAAKKNRMVYLSEDGAAFMRNHLGPEWQRKLSTDVGQCGVVFKTECDQSPKNEKFVGEP